MFAVVVVALLASYFRESPLKVRAAVVQRGPIRSLISTNGKIEAIRNLEAHAPIATTVKRLLVKEGDQVRKGQLLLQLDDADIRSQAARAQAEIKSAQAQQSALDAGGTQEEVLTLNTQLAKARTDRDLAQRNLEALRRLQQEGAASPGEVRQAEDKLQSAQADLSLLEQKKKERYSRPEAAKIKDRKSKSRGTPSLGARGRELSVLFPRLSNCVSPEMSVRRHAPLTIMIFACCPTSTLA